MNLVYLNHNGIGSVKTKISWSVEQKQKTFVYMPVFQKFAQVMLLLNWEATSRLKLHFSFTE